MATVSCLVWNNLWVSKFKVFGWTIHLNTPIKHHGFSQWFLFCLNWKFAFWFSNFIVITDRNATHVQHPTLSVISAMSSLCSQLGNMFVKVRGSNPAWIKYDFWGFFSFFSARQREASVICIHSIRGLETVCEAAYNITSCWFRCTFPGCWQN